jgi:hypothetical protein
MQANRGVLKMSVRDGIITKISAAANELSNAYLDAVKANPMAADLPVFQKLQKLQKELTAVMQEVNKVRGL